MSDKLMHLLLINIDPVQTYTCFTAFREHAMKRQTTWTKYSSPLTPLFSFTLKVTCAGFVWMFVVFLLSGIINNDGKTEIKQVHGAAEGKAFQIYIK